MPLLVWQTFLLAMASWRTGEMAMDILLPIYPGKFVISIGFALWAIQIVVSILKKIKGAPPGGRGGTNECYRK